MQCFNYFKQQGAFLRGTNGTYKIDYTKFEQAMNGLSKMILTLQGDGDHAAVAKAQAENAVISNELKQDLDKLNNKGIPVDIVFQQGVDVLGGL